MTKPNTALSRMQDAVGVPLAEQRPSTHESDTQTDSVENALDRMQAATGLRLKPIATNERTAS